jgi:uncharacterized membrane protein
VFAGRRELKRLKAAVEDNARRLAAIEKALGIVYEAPAQAPPAGKQSPTASRPALESRIGLGWINRIGVVTLILGAGFFFKLAVENQWIGEAGRVGLGLLGGLAALLAADRLRRAGQTVFAQGIAAVGIAVLYLAFYAAAALYSLLPAWFAFLLMFVATAGAAALAVVHHAPALAALGLFGGYATPLLLSAGAGQPLFYLSYVLLLDIAAVELSRRRGWRLLALLALAATVALFASWLGQPVERKWLAATFAYLYFAVFTRAPTAFVTAGAFTLAAFALTAIWPRDFVPFTLFLLALCVHGLAVATPRVALSMALAAWAAHALWYNGASAPLRLLLLAQTALLSLFLLWSVWRARALARAGLLLAPVNAASYFALAYAQLQAAAPAWTGLLTVALACVHMAAARVLWSVRAAGRMLAGIAWVLLALAVPVQFSASRIGMLWALQGAASAWIAARFRERRLAWAVVAIFIIAVAQLIFTPPPQPSAAGRVMPFAVAAAALAAAAWWLRGFGPSAPVLYAIAHFALLWGLILEVRSAAMRSVSPADLAGVTGAAVTVLMAAYAVGLVAWGVFTRSYFDRVLGLALIGLVIAKLYLYDVWLLGRVYRVTAFVALGALLLATSYLYSRYRAAIEGWWRERREGPTPGKFGSAEPSPR